MRDGWRGIFTIAASPFDERGGLRFDELRGHVDWIVRAGSHGVVWPVGYSQWTWLSHQERMKGTQEVVEAVAGRIPVVIGVAGPSATAAAAYARRAAECGADAVIAILPLGFKAASYDLVKAYYATIADAAGLPVFIQNLGPPWAALSAEVVVRLCRDIELVQYVKEEKTPQSRSCQEILDLAGDEMRGVFSGGGGSWLVSEMERGISGNMPGAPVVDICVAIWDLWHAGQVDEARKLLNLHAAYMRIWQGMPSGARKHLLVRRGVISTPFVRGEGVAQLDAVDQAELDYALSLLEPYFTV